MAKYKSIVLKHTKFMFNYELGKKSPQRRGRLQLLFKNTESSARLEEIERKGTDIDGLWEVFSRISKKKDKDTKSRTARATYKFFSERHVVSPSRTLFLRAYLLEILATEELLHANKIKEKIRLLGPYFGKAFDVLWLNIRHMPGIGRCVHQTGKAGRFEITQKGLERLKHYATHYCPKLLKKKDAKGVNIFEKTPRLA